MGKWRDYWKSNFKEGYISAFRWMGTGGYIMDVVISFVMAKFLGDTLLEGVIIFALAVFAVFGVLGLIFVIFITPYDKNIEQETIINNKKEDIEKLESNLDDIENRISRKNIKLILANKKRVVSVEQVELWINFENDSGKELSNYYARVERVGFRKDKDQEIVGLDFPNDMKLRWPDDSASTYKDMNRPISPGDTGEFSIVRTAKNFFKLDTIKNLQNVFVETGYYNIVFTVAGVVDGIGINNLIQAIIKYEGGIEIDIVDIKEI